jgi:hypothetical protein
MHWSPSYDDYILLGIFSIGIVGLFSRLLWRLKEGERLLVLENHKRHWHSKPGIYFLPRALVFRISLDKELPDWRSLSEGVLREHCIKLKLGRPESFFLDVEREMAKRSICVKFPNKSQPASSLRTILKVLILAPLLLLAIGLGMIVVVIFISNSLPFGRTILGAILCLSTPIYWYLTKDTQQRLSLLRVADSIEYRVSSIKKQAEHLMGHGTIPPGSTAHSGFFMVESLRGPAYRGPIVRNSVGIRSTVYINAPCGDPLVLIGYHSKSLAQAHAKKIQEFLHGTKDKQLEITVHACPCNKTLLAAGVFFMLLDSFLGLV